MTNQNRRRRMLYERLYAAGRRAGQRDYSLSVTVAGHSVCYRMSMAYAASLVSIPLQLGPPHNQTSVQIMVLDERVLVQPDRPLPYSTRLEN